MSTRPNTRLAAAPKSPPPRNLAGRPTSVELERRKKRMMEVATALFVQHGYAATSLIDIAKQSGVATRTIYQHFGDKEAIFQDVVFARDRSAAVAPPRIAPTDSLFDSLMKAAYYACETAFCEQSIDLMRLMVAESKRFPELIKKVANATLHQFQGNLKAVFEGLAARGLIPEGDHALSANLFADLVLGSTPMMVYTDWVSAAPSEDELVIKVELFILGRFGAAIAGKSKTVRERKQSKAAE